MKETWQKTVIFLFLLGLVVTALTLGRQDGKETGEKEMEMSEDILDNDEGKPDHEKESRIAREGKLLEGWEKAPCIVIDAGHGGYDPGKMSESGVAEKDVNLAIAKLLRDDLEACGVKVIMTREEDKALSDAGEDHAKVRDLKNRIQRIEEAKPVLALSIHQNSFPQEEISGAQVFYYCTSKEGEALARALQSRLISELDPENDRQIKENGSYYLLKKTSVPIVIAECGFLSNPEEAKKLCSAEYQEAVAWALYLGIMDYLEKK